MVKTLHFELARRTDPLTVSLDSQSEQPLEEDEEFDQQPRRPDCVPPLHITWAPPLPRRVVNTNRSTQQQHQQQQPRRHSDIAPSDNM